jgi:hypothetical protein
MVKHRLVLGVALGVLLAAAPAGAQQVYVNGVDCTGLVSARFEGATVAFDEQGNIRIEAPGYRVQVIQPGGSGGTAATPGSTTTTTTTTTGTGSTTRTSTGSGQTVVYSDSGRAMTTGSATYNPPIVEQTTTTVVTTTGGGSTATTPRTTGTTATTGSTTATAGTATTTASVPATPPTRAAGTPAPTKKYFLITQGTGGAAVGESVQVNINGQTVRTLDSAGAQIIVNVTDWLNVGGNSVTMLSTKKQTYVAGSSSSTFQVIIGEGHVESGGQVVIDNPLVTYTRTAADATANSRTFNLSAR